MSTILTTTTANLADLGLTANPGDTYFDSTAKKIVVWDGSVWTQYNHDSLSYAAATNTLSLELDGSDDHLDCGNDSALNLTSGFTINCYARQNDTGINTLIQRRTGPNGYQIAFVNGAFGYNGGTDRTFSTGFTTTDWYMLTVTHTGGTNGTLKGYVNGSLVNTFTDTYTSVTTQNFYIGKNYAGDAYSHNGYIDEVGVWSTVLSAETISDIYNNGNGPVDISVSSNLVAYWRMGDGSGDTDSGSGTPAAGATVGTVKNLANPGTHDGTGSGGALYSSTTPPN